MAIEERSDWSCRVCGGTTVYVRSNGVRAGCRTCERRRKADRRKRLRDDPEFVRHNLNANVKSRFGITVDERDDLLASQGGRCAACAEATAFNGSSVGAHVDHDHATGRVRAVLCHRCNVALGVAKESAARLRALADYVEAHA